MRRLSLLVLAVLAAQSAALARPAPPAIHGKSAIVVDVQSGRVLYHKNSREPRAVASTQKLLTALLLSLIHI